METQVIEMKQNDSSADDVLTEVVNFVRQYFENNAARDVRDRILTNYYLELDYSKQISFLEILHSDNFLRQDLVQIVGDQSIAKTEQQYLISLLAKERKPNGDCVQDLYDYQQWMQVVSALVEPIDASKSDQICIRMRDINMENPQQSHQGRVCEYAIRSCYVDTFLEKKADGLWKWRKKDQDQSGRHTVFPITLKLADGKTCKVWLKILPEQPMVEFAMYLLTQRLGLQGVVPGTIANLRLNGSEEVGAVWISADASWRVNSELQKNTKALDEVYKNNKQLLNSITMSSFTSAFMRFLVTLPEDDTAIDYRLVTKELSNGKDQQNTSYDLVRFDTERSFFTLERVEDYLIMKRKVIQVKSILYYLPHMEQVLDKEVLLSFSALNMHHLLSAWLRDVTAEHERYVNFSDELLGLFTVKEIKELFTGSKQKKQAFSILLPYEELVPELLTKLQLMQYTIEKYSDESEPLTGTMLLRQTEPLLAQRINDKVRETSSYDSTSSNPYLYNTIASLMQAQFLPDELSSSALPSSVAVRHMGRFNGTATIEDTLDSLKKERYSPSQGLLKLTHLTQNQLVEIINFLLSDNESLQAKGLKIFEKLYISQQDNAINIVTKILRKDPKAYTILQQTILLKAISKAKWQKLSLSVFSRAVTPEILSEILAISGDSLLSLNVTHCRELQQHDIHSIFIKCRNLRKLNISGLDIKELLFYDSKETMQLHTIIAANCRNLEKIELYLHKLQLIDVRTCPNLANVKVKAAHTAKALLSGCNAEKLPYWQLKSILALGHEASAEELSKLKEDMPTSLYKALESYASDEVVSLDDQGGLIKLFLHAGDNRLTFFKFLVLLNLQIKELDLRKCDLKKYPDDFRRISDLLASHDAALTSLNLAGDIRYETVVRQEKRLVPEYSLSASSYSLPLSEKYRTGRKNLPRGQRKNRILSNIMSLPSDNSKGYEWVDASHFVTRKYPQVDAGNILNVAKILKSNKSVKVLCLADNELAAAGSSQLAQALENNVHLQVLDLHNSGIRNEGVEHIASSLIKNKALRVIKLDTNDISEQGAGKLADALTANIRLEELDLYRNKIGNVGAKLIAHALKTNQRLKYLNLGDNEITDIGATELLESLKDNTTLLSLDLKDNKGVSKLTLQLINVRLQENASKLESMPQAPQSQVFAEHTLLNKIVPLEPSSLTVRVFKENLGEAAIRNWVGPVMSAPQIVLTSLALIHCGLTNAHLTLLSSNLFSRLIALQTLILANNKFNEIGLAALMSVFAHAKSLQIFDVNNNEIGDAGLTILIRQLQANTSVKTLGVAHNGITEKGVRRLLMLLGKTYSEDTSLPSEEETVYNRTLTQVNLYDNLFPAVYKEELNRCLKSNKLEISHQREIISLNEMLQNYLDFFDKWLIFANKALDEKDSVALVFLFGNGLADVFALGNEANNVIHTLKRLGWDPYFSHPLIKKSEKALTALNRARLHYEAFIEAFPSDHDSAWQRNRVTIRVWLGNYIRGRAGHVSLASGNEYLSFWPAGEATALGGIAGISVPAAFNTLIGDEKDEGPDENINWADKRRRVADYAIVFYSLNAELIARKIHELKQAEVGYNLLAKNKSGSSTSAQKKVIYNCCTAVQTVIASALRSLVDNIKPVNFMGIPDPAAVLTWVQAAKEKEIERYPLTAGFQTLVAYEQGNQKLLTAEPILLPNPSPATSEKNLFFCFRPGKVADGAFEGPPTAKPRETFITTANYQSLNDEELSFKKGDLLEKIDLENPPDTKVLYSRFKLKGNATAHTSFPGLVDKKYLKPAIVAIKTPREGLLVGTYLRVLHKTEPNDDRQEYHPSIFTCSLATAQDPNQLTRLYSCFEGDVEEADSNQKFRM